MQKNKIDGKSFDNITARIEELKAMFPEAMVEGRLDQDTLMTLLGDEFDNDNEKYQFTWKGKQASLKLAQKRSSATLRPSIDESRDWDKTQNLYIEGDNLEVLKLLQSGYNRQVKMIYIDPPYNTGNDFVYKDDFKDPMAAYKESTGQAARANPETAGRYHSNWLSMMYPRLKLAKTLLSDDGVIFISIDDNEVHNLRKVCDEVFGQDNFVSQLVWEKKKKGSFLSNQITNIKEYVLIYCRSSSKFNGLIGEINSDMETYPCVNASNKRELRTVPAGVISKYKEKNYFLPKGSEISDTTMSIVLHSDMIIEDGVLAKEMTLEGNWRYSQLSMEEYASKGEIYITRDLYLRRIVNDAREKTLKDLLPRVGDIPNQQYNDTVNINNLFESGWGSNEDADEELRLLLGVQKLFDYPKPVKLLLKIIASYREKDFIVLDFFSGSGTAAHATIQLNSIDNGQRKFIAIQLPENLDEALKAATSVSEKQTLENAIRFCDTIEKPHFLTEIGKERIRRAGDKIKSENPLTSSNLDVGFRVFKLDSSNLTKWDDDFANQTRDQQAINLFDRMENSMQELKADRREIDAVYEIMLKYGVPLTEQLATVEIAGKKFYAVGADGSIFICLDRGITIEVIEEMIQNYTPGTVIFADHSFNSDDEITNANLALEKAQIEFRWI